MDNLAIINRVIEEHHRIRENIRLAGETVNDLEALSSARRSYAAWSQSSINELAENQKKLEQVVNFLGEGLDNHFGFEEKYLPPLFGELLMLALALEHAQIRNKLAEAKSRVVGTRLEGLKQSELLDRKVAIQDVMGSLSQMIEEHASREDIVLNMIKRALENKAVGQGK